MKRMKKLSAFLLTLAIVLTSAIVPFTVSATGQSTTTVIGFSQSLVTTSCPNDAIDLAGVTSVTANANYKITSNAGLTNLATLVNAGNTFSGNKIYLTTDLNMSGVAFTPIGYNTGATNANGNGPYTFSGTFDGLGHMIDYLTVSKSDAFADVGLFGEVGEATIQNLIMGPNCSFNATTNQLQVGAIAGDCNTTATTTFKNILNLATVSGANGFFGGILGQNRSATAKFENVTNAGNVSGNSCAGGLVGFNAGTSDFDNCRNTGTISMLGSANATATSMYSGVGGFVGRDNGYVAATPDTYTNCINNGTISGYISIGGFIGVVYNATMENCYNYGTIEDKLPAVTGDSGYLYGFYRTKDGVNHLPVTTNCADRAGQADQSLIDSAEDLKNLTTFKFNLSYKITDTTGLVNFAKLVNEGNHFAGLTVYLTADLDMEGVEGFEPIGYNDENSATSNHLTGVNYFAGTFDGQNKTISNLQFHNNSVSCASIGLFGEIQGAIIRNVTVGAGSAFSTSNSSSNVGGVVGSAIVKKSTISNCKSYATVSYYGSSTANAFGYGGIVGQARVGTAVENCIFYGTVHGGNSIGGIAGYAQAAATFTNCRNLGTVISRNATGTGGIVGRPQGGVTLTGCVNNGSVTGTGNVGGLLGCTQNATVDNCQNYGEVSVTDTAVTTVGEVYGALAVATNTVTTSESAPVEQNDAAVALAGTVDAYIKADMLKIYAQAASGTTESSATTSIRLVSSVDSLSYQKVGFLIKFVKADSTESNEVDHVTSEVYTKITANSTSGIVTGYTPKDLFAASSQYFSTVTVTDVPQSMFGGKLVVTPYVVDKNGNTQKGSAQEIAIGTLIADAPATTLLSASFTAKDQKVGNVTSNPLYQITAVTYTNGTPGAAELYKLESATALEVGDIVEGTEASGNYTKVTAVEALTDINLVYHGWPSICSADNGDGTQTLYAVGSGNRWGHVDPFGETWLYKGTVDAAGNITWSSHTVINKNENYRDNRDAGITYLGNGQLVLTYFQNATSLYLDTNNSTYVAWQNALTSEQVQHIKDTWNDLSATEKGAGSFVQYSNDGGETWSQPQRVGVTAPHGVTVLQNGNLLYVGRNGGSLDALCGKVTYTNGKISTITWETLSTIAYPNNISSGSVLTLGEPHAIQLANGRILCVTRANGTGNSSVAIPNSFSMLMCYSDDNGTTWSDWSTITGEALAANSFNGAPPHLIEIDTNVVILTYGRRDSGHIGIYARISYDGGMTWSGEQGIGLTQTTNGDCGYPSTAVISEKDGVYSLITAYYGLKDDVRSILYTTWKLTPTA